MDTKIKVIIMIFVLIAILYMISYIMSTMNSMKKKETFIEMQVEELEKDSTAPSDPRLDILNTIEQFVEDKEERVEIMNAMFRDIDQYKNMSKDALTKTVETFVSGRKKESFVETKKKNETAEVAVEESTKSKYDVTTLKTDIGTVHKQLGEIMQNINQMGTAETVKKVAVKAPVIEKFVNGFENVPNYASYSLL